MGSSPIVPTKPSIAHLLLWTVFALFVLLAPLSLALARPPPFLSLAFSTLSLVPSAFAPCSALVLFGVLFVAIYRDAPRSSPSPPPSAQFSATFPSSSYTLTGKNRNFAFVILSLVQESLLLSPGLSMTLKTINPQNALKHMPEQKNTAPRRKKASAPIDPTYGHLQPQAIDVEKVVLGALMIDKDAFSVVSELIRPETFYDPRHQKIFKAIQTLNMEEKPVDILTVTNELEREGTITSPHRPTSSSTPRFSNRSSLPVSSSPSPATSRQKPLTPPSTSTNSCRKQRAASSSSRRKT